jgi:hypothetical protein
MERRPSNFCIEDYGIGGIMPSRRRSANKNLGNNLSDVQRRIRSLERRPARSRLGAKSVTTAAIGAEVITPEQVNFGTVTVGSPGDITDPKDGQLVINPNDGSVSVYNGDNDSFIDIGDPQAFDLSVTAFAAANTAVQTANGKSKVTYSLSAPGTTANNAGDIWWQYTSGNIISGQWTGLGGTSWQANTVGNAVIANLDAGKITSGFIQAARINAGTITANMIAATALDAKTITGSTIQTSSATTSKVILDTSGLRAINSSGTTTVNISTSGTAVFNGEVTASSFTATGLVDGNDLANNAIVNRHIESLSASKINAGTINAAVISVTNLNASNITAGSINASAISVTNLNASNIVAGTITGRTITNGTTFTVSDTGVMTATSGRVGGFQLGNGDLTGSTSGSGGILPRIIFGNKIAIGWESGSNYQIRAGNPVGDPGAEFYINTATSVFRFAADSGARQYAGEVRNAFRAATLRYTTSLVNESSSRRFKENITYAPKRYYDRILEISPAFWKYKDEHPEVQPEQLGTNSFGVIAEDLEEAGLGYFVERNMEGLPTAILNMHEMPLLLIPIVRELKAALQELTLRVETLEAQ